MLQGRLSAAAAALVAATLLGACAGADGTDRGALREAVVEPGVTALDETPGLACAAEASAFRTALESYELLEGEPAPDEAALIPRYVREESELWDVVDGALVAADPACADVETEVPAPDIVTATDPGDAGADAAIAEQLAAMTPDDILATLTPDEIDEVGGRECALEVAEVGLAFSRWQFENPSVELTSLDQVVAGGHLGPLELWSITETQLVAAGGSDCIGPLDLLEPAG